MLNLFQLKHPCYAEPDEEQLKWRLTYEGGQRFVRQYLQKLSKREEETDFTNRKLITYCPAFAAVAVDEIKNSIYNRMGDITRTGGVESYQSCVMGLNGGVDLSGQGMNAFIGSSVLEELLVMRRVGILVDNVADLGTTLRDKGDKHPYLVQYNRENILSWSYELGNNTKRLRAILLREEYNSEDEMYWLPHTKKSRYRYMRLVNNGVEVTLYENDSSEGNTVFLNIPEIPFYMLETNRSMLHNVCDYQIALLNIESSDISFVMKSNYPFFYEFFDPKSEQQFGKPVAVPGATGVASEAVSKDREVKTGASQGRRYPAGTQPPGFTNPSPETLMASMRKSDAIKQDIRKLVMLNLQSVGQQKQSAESKEEDRRGLESSLSYIGLLLQTAENEIGKFWSRFESSEVDPRISYPKDYSLKSDQERQEEAESIEEASKKVPSLLYKKEMLKQVVKLRVGHLVTFEQLEQMYKEIDSATTLNTDAKEILEDHKAGLVGDETASLARGYKKGEADQARKDRAERIKITMEAQGGPQGANPARGMPEAQGKTSADEKQDKPKRGEAK